MFYIVYHVIRSEVKTHLYGSGEMAYQLRALVGSFCRGPVFVES